MSGFNNPIIGGGGGLVYPSIHSPNFVTNSVGWTINKDGTAQFTGLTILGGLVLNYSLPPGAGKLIQSSAPIGGTDAFGNVYLAGEVTYEPVIGGFKACQNFGGSIILYTAASEAGPWTAIGMMQLFGSIPTTTFQMNTLPGGTIQIQNRISIIRPSGDATGATDTAALAAAITSGATPWLAPGTFHVNCGNATLTGLGPGQYILSSGDLATIINAHGSGDLFYWSALSPNSDGSTTGGGFIGGGTIDGSACSGAAVGIHAGDINALRFDCRCQHFTKTGGSWGFLFDNANTFTERLRIDIRAKDCGFAGGDGGMVGFQVSGATTSTASFSRLRGRIEITQGSNQQDGLVLQAGAHIYDAELEVVGNFQGNASNPTTAAAIRLTGTVPVGHPGAGTHSAISNTRLDVGVECSSATNAPTTIVQASSSNSITATYGNMNFNQNFTSAGLAGAGFKYAGQVQGDASLGTRLFYGTSQPQTITANGQTIQSLQPSAKVVISSAGFTGLILSAGDVDGQEIFLINTGAGGAIFAASPGSNLAGGVGTTLGPGTGIKLIWDAGTALWYGK